MSAMCSYASLSSARSVTGNSLNALSRGSHALAPFSARLTQLQADQTQQEDRGIDASVDEVAENLHVRMEVGLS